MIYRSFLFILRFALCSWAIPLLPATELDKSPPPSVQPSKFHLLHQTLPNGIQLYLLPLPASSDDPILIRGFARGGFADLPKGERAAFEMAPSIARESGFGPYTGKSLTKFLNKWDLDLLLKVDPFHRVIEGSAHGEQLSLWLQLLAELFQAPKFSEESFQLIQERTLYKSALPMPRETFLDDNLLLLKEPEAFYLRHLSGNEIREALFADSKRLYFDRFLTPSDFTFVIVGDFDPKKTISLLTEKLSSLLAKKQPILPTTLQLSPPTKGISRGAATYPLGGDSVAQIHIPLHLQLNEERLLLLDIATQTIESRLRTLFQKKLGSTKAIDVGYEFPYYPKKDGMFVFLQYRFKDDDSFQQKLIFEEIQRLEDTGPSLEELKRAITTLTRTQKIWEERQEFWSKQIVNFLLWNFDPKNILQEYPPPSPKLAQEIQRFLQESFSLDQSSIFSLKAGEPSS